MTATMVPNVVTPGQSLLPPALSRFGSGPNTKAVCVELPPLILPLRMPSPAHPKPTPVRLFPSADFAHILNVPPPFTKNTFVAINAPPPRDVKLDPTTTSVNDATKVKKLPPAPLPNNGAVLSA